MRARSALSLGFAVLLAACASKGFNRGELSSQIGVKDPVVSDQAIKEALAQKPNLPKPFRLGVYFKPPVGRFGGKAEWRWTDEDKAIFSGLATDLKDKGVVSDVFPVFDSVV